MQLDESKVCLSIQRALLDAVTKNLRRLSFIVSENLITLYFFYDGEPSEIEKELTGDIAAEVISDFEMPYNIDCQMLRVDFPNKIKSQGRIVFSRFE